MAKNESGHQAYKNDKPIAYFHKNSHEDVGLLAI